MGAVGALGALVALAGSLPSGAAGESPGTGGGCSVPGQIQVDSGGWTAIKAPAFPRGSALLSAYAVNPSSPDRMFATNGRMVMRSGDAGCTWTEAFMIPDAPSSEIPFSSTAATVRSIVVPRSSVASGRAYLLIREELNVDGTAVPRAHVLRSLDGGAPGSWEAADSGVLPYGEPEELIASESAPDVLFLTTTIPDGPSSRATALYSSKDAGSSWDLIASPSLTPEGLLPELRSVAVDPLDARRLWAAGPEGLWRSATGGSDWERVPELEQAAVVVDVFHAPGMDARIWGFGPAFSPRSDDGGTEWREMEVISGIQSAASDSADHVFATAILGGRGAAYGFDAAEGGWLLLREFNETLRGASVDLAAAPSFYAHSQYRIFKLSSPGPDSWLPGELIDEPFDPEGGMPCTIAGNLPDPSGIRPRIPELSPAIVSLTLPPGQEETVPYHLKLWKRHTPVDLDFLIDTTSSMAPAICHARRSAAGVAARLQAVGLDVRFGLGAYKDYPIPRYGSGAEEYVYRRVRKVGPLNTWFLQGLASLRAADGGDLPESQLTALLQAATGEGQSPWILSDQDAGFQPKRIPVILNITDAAFHGDEPQYPGPGWQRAMEALRAAGVRQVGLGYTRNCGPGGTGTCAIGALPPLRRAARESGGVAGPRGADCTGDGFADIPEGAPLVCRVRPSTGNPHEAKGIADAIAEMVLALRDEATVSLAVVSDEGQAVRNIEPPSTRVDLRSDNPLDFKVTYGCRQDQAGETLDVELAAHVLVDATGDTQVVATTKALITCLPELPDVPPIDVPPIVDDESPPVGLGAAPPVIPPPPIGPAPVLGPAPAPAPAPGPAPVPEPIMNPAPQPQPNPQAQANPNPQPQSQAQAGLAPQKQEQAQTALATAQQRVAEQEEYSMSARSDRRRTSRLPIAAGGAVALAFGCLAVRRRTQRAEARWR